jgi:hypothetical protein
MDTEMIVSPERYPHRLEDDILGTTTSRRRRRSGGSDELYSRRSMKIQILNDDDAAERSFSPSRHILLEDEEEEYDEEDDKDWKPVEMVDLAGDDSLDDISESGGENDELLAAPDESDLEQDEEEEEDSLDLVLLLKRKADAEQADEKEGKKKPALVLKTVLQEVSEKLSRFGRVLRVEKDKENSGGLLVSMTGEPVAMRRVVEAAAGETIDGAEVEITIKSGNY